MASLDLIGEMADKADGNSTAVAIYMLSAQLTSVILLASEEICEALEKRRKGLF